MLKISVTASSEDYSWTLSINQKPNKCCSVYVQGSKISAHWAMAPEIIGMNQVTSEWLRSQSSSCVQPKFIPPELFGRVTSRKNDIKIGTSLPIGGKAKATIKILCRWNSSNQNVHGLPRKLTADNIFTNMGSRKTDYRLTNGKYMCMR